MNAEISALLWKEVRQVPRKRAAIVSAFFFPVLMMIALPAANLAGMKTTQLPPGALNLPGFSGSDDPAILLRDFLLPLCAALGGLVVPSIAATYTIIAERERNTLELLVALPVTVGQIVIAKLGGVVLLAVAIAIPLFAVQAVGIVVLGIAGMFYVLQLLLLLIAAVVYSASSALMVGLLSKDFRTANNINGVLLGPAIVVSVAALILLPNDFHILALGALLLCLAATINYAALRMLSVERLLR